MAGWEGLLMSLAGVAGVMAIMFVFVAGILWLARRF